MPMTVSVYRKMAPARTASRAARPGARGRDGSAAKTADRTLDVFELFANEQRPLNLSEIAARLAIPLASAHALLKTLEARGYLFDVGQRRGYFPTTRMQGVVQAIVRALPLASAVEPALRALRDETGETVVLAKRQGDQLLYVAVFESPCTVRFSSVAGEVKPLHSTSSGKALLSALPREELAATLAELRFDRRTAATVLDPGELARQIERGRARGWCRSVGENAAELMAVSAPVRIGAETYAVTLGGPTGRFRPRTARHVAALLRTCARVEGRTAGEGAARRRRDAES